MFIWGPFIACPFGPCIIPLKCKRYTKICLTLRTWIRKEENRRKRRNTTHKKCFASIQYTLHVCMCVRLCVRLWWFTHMLAIRFYKEPIKYDFRSKIEMCRAKFDNFMRDIFALFFYIRSKMAILIICNRRTFATNKPYGKYDALNCLWQYVIDTVIGCFEILMDLYSKCVHFK